MRRTCLAVSILSTSIVVAPLSAQPTQAEVAGRPETSHLKPSSPWNLDFGETRAFSPRSDSAGIPLRARF